MHMHKILRKKRDAEERRRGYLQNTGGKEKVGNTIHTCSGAIVVAVIRRHLFAQAGNLACLDVGLGNGSGAGGGLVLLLQDLDQGTFRQQAEGRTLFSLHNIQKVLQLRPSHLQQHPFLCRLIEVDRPHPDRQFCGEYDGAFRADPNQEAPISKLSY